MEMMKKITLVVVVAALCVAGYLLVHKHYSMSKSDNVVIQNQPCQASHDNCPSGQRCQKSRCV